MKNTIEVCLSELIILKDLVLFNNSIHFNRPLLYTPCLISPNYLYIYVYEQCSYFKLIDFKDSIFLCNTRII